MKLMIPGTVESASRIVRKEENLKTITKHCIAGTIVTGALFASLLFGSMAAFAAPYYGNAAGDPAGYEAAADEYIFPTSSSSLLYDSQFEGMTREMLRLGRNEIYARHGRRFNDQALQQYFDSKSWYHGTIAPGDFNESVLNTWERRNVQLIINAEQGPFTASGGVERVASSGTSGAAGNYTSGTAGNYPSGTAGNYTSGTAGNYTPLTAEELRAYDNLFIPCNGFFTCVYSNPYEISWPNVFYDGIEGADVDYYTAVRSYEAATGEEVFTDVTAIPLSEIEAFVRKTTGTEYSQAQRSLNGEWVWLPDLQAYAHQHGDTNRRGIEFTSGEYSGDTMTLHFMSSSMDTGYDDRPFTAVLVKNGSGGWYFQSCRPD